MLSHCSGRRRAREAVRASLRCLMKIASSPAAPFRHLQRLTDNVGVLERAHGIVPRYEHGYRVDDVACGLVVVCREPSPSAELITLGRRYLYFLARAQAADGKFRNRLGEDRRWRGKPEAHDAWGRSLWALGTAAARGPTAGIRAEARARFDASARVGSPYPHSMAFAALGAAEVLQRWPGDPGALSLLAIAGTVIGEPPADAAWPWPAPRLSYANAAIAEAVIVTGEKLGRGHLLRNGLGMLGWLLAGETRDGHLSGGAGRGLGPRRGPPRFRPAPEPGGGARRRLRARRGGHRRQHLADWRGDEREVAARRQRRRHRDVRPGDWRLQRCPRPHQPQPQPGRGVNPGDDSRAPAGPQHGHHSGSLRPRLRAGRPRAYCPGIPPRRAIRRDERGGPA